MWKYKHKNICIFYWLNIKILLYCNKWVFKDVNTPAYVMWFLCFHIRICIYNCMFLIRFLHGISCADLIIQHFQEELSWISFLPKVLSLLFLFLFPFVGLFVRCVLSKPASSCTLLFYFLMVFHFCFLCHKHTSLVGKFQVKTTWKHALRVFRVKRGTDYNFCLCLLPFFFFTLCCILQRCE